MKRALITGVTGQDGSYLAEFLLNNDYEVWGLARETSRQHFADNLHEVTEGPHAEHFHFIAGDITDPGNVMMALQTARPTEIYNLAAQSSVSQSWRVPRLTFDVNLNGFINLIEAVIQFDESIRIYQASSSEQFGGTTMSSVPRVTNSRMIPRSPYGVSKLSAHRLANAYRRASGIFIACGICFNHESPRRGDMFVSRKIAKAAAAMAAGKQDSLVLGNVNTRRDFGFARDYIPAMWQMLAIPEPDDFVLATGESHSILDMVNVAFMAAGFDALPMDRITFGAEEFVRPGEPSDMVGDTDRALKMLDWHATTTFEDMVTQMVTHEFFGLGVRLAEQSRRDHPKSAGG